MQISILQYAKRSGANIRFSHCHLFYVITAPKYFALVSLDGKHDMVYRGEYSKKTLSNSITNMRKTLSNLFVQSLQELPLKVKPVFTVEPLYYHTLGAKLKKHFAQEFNLYRVGESLAFA